jgi:hypothetical protein
VAVPGPREESVLDTVLAAPEEVLASHLLDPRALELLRAEEYTEFLAYRGELVIRAAREPFFQLAGWSSE